VESLIPWPSRSVSRLAVAGWLVCTSIACGAGAPSPDTEIFAHIQTATAHHIAVYGTKTVSDAQFARAYGDITDVLDAMDPRIRRGLLGSDAKIIVAKDEAELIGDIDYYETIFPLEAVFVDIDDVDETLPGDFGVSTSRLELMYLVVYYALLTDPELASIYDQLIAAYDEAAGNGVFSPGEAYRDSFFDDIHPNASRNNALKYGSYLFGLYRVHFGNGTRGDEEFTIATRDELRALNPRGAAFIEAYLDGGG